LTLAQFAGKFTSKRGFLRCALHTHGRGLDFFKAFQGFSRLLFEIDHCNLTNEGVSPTTGHHHDLE